MHSGWKLITTQAIRTILKVQAAAAATATKPEEDYLNPSKHSLAQKTAKVSEIGQSCF